MTGQTSRRVSRSAQALLLGSLAASLLLVTSGCTRAMPGAVDASTTGVTSLRQDFELGSAAVASVEQTVPEPTGEFAQLRGQFVLTGGAPGTLAPLSADKDLQVCAADGSPPNEALVVDSNGGMANVLIYADPQGYKIPIGDAKWEHEEYLQAPTILTGLAGFDQKNCVFISHVFAMRSSQTLEIINSDTVGHNTDLQGATGRTARENYQVASNSTVIYQPKNKSARPFKVTCGAHSWMAAYFHVLDHPFFAVSKADGSFEVKHVPCGVPLSFRIWHESANKLAKLTVDGKEVSLSNGRLDLAEFQAGEERVLKIEIDVSNFSKLFN